MPKEETYFPKIVLNKILEWIENSGGFGSPKVVFVALVLLYALYTYMKSKGWLPKKSLKGEHVFLTGAGSGLGRKMAITLARMGANLSLSDVNIDSLEETQNLIIAKVASAAENVHTFKCDVSSKEQIAEAATIAKNKFGDVTLLINNAGIVSGKTILENTES